MSASYSPGGDRPPKVAADVVEAKQEAKHIPHTTASAMGLYCDGEIICERCVACGRTFE